MRRILPVLALLALGGAGGAAAQFGSFGQNKIQYRRFDWQVVRGPHVDLYYYPEEAHLAAPALAYAEASYDTLALQFGHEVRERIPLIVYASHVDFEQTNILPFIPPEGLLGATDFLKRRVTLPFRGNFSEFRHTLRHEMVHVFQLSLALEAYHHNARFSRVQIPLWWSEGLAELWSGGEDARDEMILRDLVMSGRLPGIEELEFVSGGIVYPLGGRIHRWLADTYGDWRVAMFYREFWRYDSFADAIASIYGRSLARLGEEYKLAMRRAYLPTAMDREPLALAARSLARAAVKPAWGAADSAGEAYYVTAASGYITIRRLGLDGGKPTDVAVTGKSAGLESLHPFDSRIDPSRPGYLLFSAKSGDRDALVIWDVRKRKVAGRYQFPELVSILSPAWGPEGTVLFSGLARSGVSDLYRVRLPEGTLERLTDDPYQDLDPSLSPDSARVVFASDRTAGGREGAANLFVMDLASGRLSQLTAGDWVDEAPRWGADGRVYFASDRDGVLNVFSVDDSGRGRRETSAWTGAFDPAYVPERGGLLVGGFTNLNWSVYYYPPDSAARSDTFALAPVPAAPGRWEWPAGETAATAVARREPYRKRLTLDFAAGEGVFIPGVGGLQGAQFFLSDLLGDHVLLAGIATYQGRNLGNILENLNASGLYVNQKHRLNWGVGAFRTNVSAYSGPFLLSYRERTYGVLGVLRYPFDRFSRLQAEGVIERSNRIDFDLPDGSAAPGAFRRIGWIGSNYLSYVRDNSLWLPSGPIDGSRIRLTGGLSGDFSNGRFDSYLLNADLRRYFRLGTRAAYAVRLYGWYSGSERPRRVNIGGTHALRGYPLYGAVVGSRAFLANQEIRFPLLNFLSLGTPLGGLRLPELQGALFFDVGKAWYLDYDSRALLGSYGLSFRWALAPFLVLRLDWGRRFSDNDFQGYPLTPQQRRPGFLQFFFGYNY